MSQTIKKSLKYNPDFIPSAKGMKIGIVVAEWNSVITDSLLKGAYETLIEHGASHDDILIRYVPGSFELPLGAKFLLEYTDMEAVICLGCVIQGETRHFEFICNSVANSVLSLSLEFTAPVIFGVLTTNNIEQAKERSGGSHGNKGSEAAVSAIKMIALENDLLAEQ